jgi:hypothetical protein
VTSIQNMPDRKRVEAITISRQTRSKTPPTGLGAQCGTGHNKTAPQSPADDAPSVQLHAQPLHAPSADASGRATRLVRAPHRTDGNQDGQSFRTGGASSLHNRDAQGVHRRIEAGQDRQIRRRWTNSTQMETSYDDLRRACRRRDPGCIDPLRHVFEDAMSDVLPLHRTRSFRRAAWRPDLEEPPSARRRRSRTSSDHNRRIQLITDAIG